MYISVLLWNRFSNSVNDRWMSPLWYHLDTNYHVMSKYHHAPKQAWLTGVLIQCRYGLSNVILYIFLIILNIWICYTITFCRFTFCFYILMAKHTNRGKQSVFNEKHLQKIIFRKLKNYEIMWKKRTDIGAIPWIRKKKLK